jgi:hypothetical protein
MDNATPEAASIALLTQQLLNEFTYDVDVNESKTVTSFYTVDGSVNLAMGVYNGHAEIRKYYDEFGKMTAGRTARHTFMNFRFYIESATQAVVNFVSIYYSGPGAPPVTDFTGPSVVSDCRVTCKREADGKWRIFEFHARPIFRRVAPAK